MKKRFIEKYGIVLGLVPLLDLWRRRRGREKERSLNRVGLIQEDGGLGILFIVGRLGFHEKRDGSMNKNP